MMIQVFEDFPAVKEAIEKWLKLKYPSQLLSNQTILLKPNLGYPKPSPYTTSLELVKTIVEALNNLHVKKIIIAEGSTSTSSALENFKTIGVYDTLKDFQIDYLDFNTCEFSKVNSDSNVTHYLPTILKEVDLRISVPVIKFYYDDQKEIFLSNAIKNFFGLPPKQMYQKSEESHMRDSLHQDLHKSVAEIYLAVESFSPFDLFICDGTQILHGEASIGEPLDWGKIILSDNAIAADLKVLDLLQKPKPRYLKYLTK
ncbi:MAG: DUF362 domain-containing protein [Asgard group archaeon]|nr:DUF362 domain-containing protein [Asgard group archaeon]